MKHLQKFETFKINEEFFKDSFTNQEIKFFNDILKDFKDNNEDLKKVHIIDDGGSKISFSEIVIGNYYTISYVFGKWHPVKRDIHSGNKEAGDRRIKITSIPTSLTLRKNELEKAFNTDRFQLGKVTVKEELTTNNYERNPATGNHRLYNTETKEYKISSKLGLKLLNYFKELWEEKYPGVNSRYKGPMIIREIEKGISPTLRYGYTKSKDGVEVTYAIRKGDNEKDIIKKINNMTREEYDLYYKQENEKLYKKSDDLTKKEKNTISEEIDKLFKANNIILEPTEWEPLGFRLSSFIKDFEFRVEFKSEKDIKDKVKEILSKNKISGYTGDLVRVSDGYSEKSIKHYLIIFEK